MPSSASSSAPTSLRYAGHDEVLSGARHLVPPRLLQGQQVSGAAAWGHGSAGPAASLLRPDSGSPRALVGVRVGVLVGSGCGRRGGEVARAHSASPEPLPGTLPRSVSALSFGILTSAHTHSPLGETRLRAPPLSAGGPPVCRLGNRDQGVAAAATRKWPLALPSVPFGLF